MDIDLHRTYVYLTDGADARAVEVDERFWAEIGARAELHDGRLVCQFAMRSDWDHWEMHPGGDEILVLLSGRLDLVLDAEGGERIVELRAGRTCIVPAGVWHTARVREPAKGTDPNVFYIREY